MTRSVARALAACRALDHARANVRVIVCAPDSWTCARSCARLCVWSPCQPPRAFFSLDLPVGRVFSCCRCATTTFAKTCMKIFDSIQSWHGGGVGISAKMVGGQRPGDAAAQEAAEQWLRDHLKEGLIPTGPGPRPGTGHHSVLQNSHPLKRGQTRPKDLPRRYFPKTGFATFPADVSNSFKHLSSPSRKRLRTRVPPRA